MIRSSLGFPKFRIERISRLDTVGDVKFSTGSEEERERRVTRILVK